MIQDSHDRLHRNKQLLDFYSPILDHDNQIQSPHDPKSIDSSAFNPSAYFTDLLQKCDLDDLMAKETEINEQIRSLDSEMQTLVYDNYKKFINATSTIKMMKSDFKFIEDEMNSLAESMIEISRYSNEIDQETRENRLAIQKLTTTAESLQKLSYLSSLPTKIREYLKNEKWADAVEAYCKGKKFFEKHHMVPSFREINKECTELINIVATELEERLHTTHDPTALSSSVEILKQLGRSLTDLSERFLEIASQFIDDLLLKQRYSKKKEIEEQAGEFSDDAFNFANTATDIFTDAALSYVFAYSSCFLCNTPGENPSPENFEIPLFKLLKDLMYKFFTLVDERLIDEIQVGDTSLLARALERLYSRMKSFGRSVLEVVSPNELSSSANEFQQCLDEACLDMILRTSLRCCERQFELLKFQVADCLTDLRQQMVTNCSLELKNREIDGCSQTTMEIYDEMSRALATHLRDCLNNLKVFLSNEFAFARIERFRATFCLQHVREGLVEAYLRFLVKFCENLSKCNSTTTSSIPGAVILLLGKLCVDWANSGTVGHLLCLADDFLLIGLPKSSVAAKCQQQAVQQMLAASQKPPTPPGPLAEEFRVASSRLLMTFVKLEGAQIGHMLRKSLEVRDWLRCQEPRTVRSVIRRVLEDLARIDLQVSQLLPPLGSGGSRAKDIRGSGDSRYSWRSSLTPHRSVSGQSALAAADHSSLRHTATSSQQQQRVSVTLPDYDPTLASQLRRLFSQRVDVFSPVEPTRESVLFGVIKIVLRAFMECARTCTFGKFGLQQIQVDCHYLYIHLWKFVSDEKQVHMMLDDVMFSVVQRCVEPHLMEDGLVDVICDSSRSGSDRSK